MSAIFKKELKGYFSNMTGYVFVAVLLIAAGIFLAAYNLLQGYPYYEKSLQGMDFIFLVVVPLITMNSLSQERRNKTDQLLLTSPVKVWEIVLGKFLAMLSVLAIPILIMATFPLILTSYGEINLGTAYATLFAFFLLGGTLIAIGMFISSLTESSVIAAVSTIGVMLLIYLMNAIEDMIPVTSAASFIGMIVFAAIIAVLVYLFTKNTIVSIITLVVLAGAAFTVYMIDASLFQGLIQKVINKFALFNAIDTFAEGKLDLVEIVYYISVSFLFGFFTVRTIDKRRWN